MLIGAQVKVASIMVGTASWFDSWEQNGGEEIWAQKTPQLELLGGARYYLEAEHRGRAPSSGVRIGVQIHNTWLNPEVVNTYLWEKHQIRAHAQRLPEIQVCMFLPVSWGWVQGLNSARNTDPPSGRMVGWEPGDLSCDDDSAAKETGYPSNRIVRTLKKITKVY